MSQDQDGMEAVQLRTQALWPQIAAELRLPVDGVRFRRLQTNTRHFSDRCALDVLVPGHGRIVLRADFEDGQNDRRLRCVIHHRTAWAALEAEVGVAVPEILWQHPTLPVVAMEYVAGETALRELAMADLGLASRRDTIRRVGLALGALHRSTNAGERKFWPKPFLQRVNRLADEVRTGRRHPPKPKKFLGLCAFLHQLGRRARGQDVQVGLEHGDFHFGNVLLAEDAAYLIDFGAGGHGYPLRDIATLWLMKCPNYLASVGEAEGFGAIAKPDWDAFVVGYGTDPSADPVFQFLFAIKLMNSWSGMGVSGETGERLAECARGAERVFEALRRAAGNSG